MSKVVSLRRDQDKAYDRAGGLLLLETDICDLEHAARLALEKVVTSSVMTRDGSLGEEAETEMVMFAVGQVLKMAEDLRRQYYRLADTKPTSLKERLAANALAFNGQ